MKFTWFKETWEWSKLFFNAPPDNKPSMKRWIMFIVTVCFVVSYMHNVIITRTLTDIPTLWAATIGGMLGLGIMANKIEKLK